MQKSIFLQDWMLHGKEIFLATSRWMLFKSLEMSALPLTMIQLLMLSTSKP